MGVCIYLPRPVEAPFPTLLPRHKGKQGNGRTMESFVTMNSRCNYTGIIRYTTTHPPNHKRRAKTIPSWMVRQGINQPRLSSPQPTFVIRFLRSNILPPLPSLTPGRRTPADPLPTHRHPHAVKPANLLALPPPLPPLLHGAPDPQTHLLQPFFTGDGAEPVQPPARRTTTTTHGAAAASGM